MLDFLASQYSSVQYSTVQFSTAEVSTVPYSTVTVTLYYSTVLNSTVQFVPNGIPLERKLIEPQLTIYSRVMPFAAVFR